MSDQPCNKYHPHPSFHVPPQQPREHSLNISILSSVYNNLDTYRQLQTYFQSLPSSPFLDLSSLHSSPKLKLKKYKEAVYYGQFQQGKRHGKGIMMYNSGQKYQGEWKDDMRNGKGYQVFGNGSVYEGEYRGNKMDGIGKYVWNTGEVYQGEWKDNGKNGTGAWKNIEGDSYVGEWKNGQACGFGVYTQARGSRYQGEFLDFVKHGKGTEKFISGDLYQGHYQNGRFHGQGQYFWSDSSFYKGQFLNGLRHGFGLLKHTQSQQKYQGQFFQNKKQGYGISTFASGSIYKGNYHSNMRQGYGQMYWSDGTFYKGIWMVDKANGKGELFDGIEIVRGVFRDGELVEIQGEEESEGTRGDSTRGISQFYYDVGHKVKPRVVVTPIRKITEDPTERFSNHNRRLISSQVDKDAEVRQIRPSSKLKKHVSPLLRDSFVRKKLMQTIRNQPQRTVRLQSRQIFRTIVSKSRDPSPPAPPHSKQKVMHSSFQIHKLYNRNKQPKSSNPNQLKNSNDETTIDNNESFAFGRNNNGKQGRNKQRGRYLSQLE